MRASQALNASIRSAEFEHQKQAKAVVLSAKREGWGEGRPKEVTEVVPRAKIKGYRNCM